MEFMRMGAGILIESEAVDRLTELDLSAELIERVIRRADAEASMCTALDPPIMEGLTRWGRMNRFLREELIPAGWRFDNPRNLPRTIHPSGEFAIVATTGDELTGLADAVPATKYLKGDATVRAVETNEQLTLDFDDFDLGQDDGRADSSGDLLTWFLLYHANEEGFRVELSLPDAIVDGRIISWAERIILPVFPRLDDRLADSVTPGGGDVGEDVVVEVTRR
jgi:hypothetical protein